MIRSCLLLDRILKPCETFSVPFSYISVKTKIRTAHTNIKIAQIVSQQAREYINRTSRDRCKHVKTNTTHLSHHIQLLQYPMIY